MGFGGGGGGVISHDTHKMYDSAAHLKKPTISNVFIRKKLVGSQILYVALKISPRIWKKNRPCLMSLLEKKMSEVKFCEKNLF